MGWAGVWRSLAWGVLGAGIGLWLPQVDADDAEDLLRRALQSEQRLNYQGQRLEIYWSEQGTVAVLVQEYGTADGKRRVEWRLPGRNWPEVFIENGSHLWYSSPTHFLWQSHTLPSLLFPQRWKLLRSNYEFRRLPGGLDHVARRPTVVIEARPREPRKGRLIFWIDRDRPFILRIERYGADRSPVSRSAFETIQFTPSLDPELFALPQYPGTSDPPVWRPITLRKLQEQLGPLAVLPVHLALGYQLQEALHKPEKNSRRVQAHLVYTDGLDTISLFALRPAPLRDWRRWEQLDLPEPSSHPSVWLRREGRFSVVNWQAGDVEQSLVTELPPEAVRAIAGKIVPRHAPPRPLLRRRHPHAWLPALLAATLVFLLLKRCLRPRWL